MPIPTVNDFENAYLDMDSIKKCINGDDLTDVLSRLGRMYPTLAKAMRLIVENGLLGAKPYNTKALLDAALAGMAENAYAVVTDDQTLDANGVKSLNGFYQNKSGVLVYLAWNPLSQFLTAQAAQLAKIESYLANLTKKTAVFSDAGELTVYPSALKDAVKSNANKNTYWNSDFAVWAIPFKLTEDSVVDSINLSLINTDNVLGTLKVMLYEQTTEGSANTLTFNNKNLIHTTTITATAAFGGRTTPTSLNIDCGGKFFKAGTRLIARVELLNLSNANVALGCAQQAYDSVNDEPFLRGFFNQTSNTTFQEASIGNRPFGRLMTKSSDVLLNKLSLVMQQFTAVEDVTYDTGYNAQGWDASPAAQFTKWAIGVNNTQVITPTAVEFLVQNIPNIHKLKLVVHKRPLTMGDGNGESSTTAMAPGANSVDIKIFEKDYIVATELDVNTTMSARQVTKFALVGIEAFLPSNIYFFTLTAQDASNAEAYLGMGQTSFETSEPNWPRGFYVAGAVTNTNMGVLSGTNGLSFKLYSTNYKLPVTSTTSDSSVPSIIENVEASTAAVDSNTFNITIPAMTINQFSKTVAVESQFLTVDSPITASVSNTISLVYSANGLGYLGTNALSYQYTSSLVVKRSSDAATLVQGVDWDIKTDTGWVYGKQDVAPFNVDCTFTGHNHRYDLVYVDPTTGVVGIAKGTDRIIDPEHYMPVLPANKIALFSLYVTKNGVDFQAVHQYRNQQKITNRMDYAEWLEYCRSCLSKTFGRGRSGQSIKLIGYGDSITQCGFENSAHANDYQLKANWGRDHTSFLTRIPSDTIAALPQFDSTNPHFADCLTGGHIKIGWNWFLKDTLEKRFGISVDYRNWGIGGTTSANTLVGGKYNGLHTDRMAAMLADGGHLMVLAFGMNELGSSTTYANCRSIIEQFKATGGEVIVLPPPQINSVAYKEVTQAKWQFTCAELVRCAIDTNSAYVPVAWIESVTTGGATGLSAKNLCNSNLFNHPSINQLAQIGKFMARIVV